MCGIHAVIELIRRDGSGCTASNNTQNEITITDTLRRRLCSRGPDHLGHAAAEYTPSHTRHRAALQFTSTVLALRGDGLTPQPFSDSASNNILCWNGEAWKLNAADVSGNDGRQLFDLLSSADGDDVLQVLRSIDGPFAFVYYDQPAGRLYYGRDRLGRRSLLQQQRKDGRLSLSSVSDVEAGAAGAASEPWTEVEADGIYVLNLEADGPLKAQRHDWSTEHAGNPLMVSGLGLFNMSSVPPEGSRIAADSPSVRQLHDQLAESLRLRVKSIPRPPSPISTEGDTRVAVLFSGGLDCTVLARMSHDLVPADQGIDLINVAFENPRVASHLPPGVTDVYEACPDRVTGRRSCAELQHVCPARRWRFVAVNVPYTENLEHRPEIVALMHPHNTEMDLSITSALYFAARATATMPARVLLSGLGADELFGGYGRHGVAYKAKGGYAGLADELRLDVSRLGQRNLGRDDRVFSHWGREVRFPFLDEELVRWAIALPAWDKCDFAHDSNTEEEVEPAKRVLRLVALSLGMAGVAQEKKRAIQFGARTAKMESGRVKGTALVS
ncbi:asparagine synthase [Ophiostoma piceae UAMH 11346]|uniref:Asparagine synthase n=1 Tax=Ophiostoma piceae (strain UAMH 11346) TaxID=1262450 RepID=S3C896_OPHP1|nr:asparagine synthase [Ophiostoma piceae UAMH 11346]